MGTAYDGARILGFEFVEYAAPDPAAFGAYLSRVGFTAIARHRSKDVVLYRQNGINIIVNSDVESFEQSYSHLRGVRICAIALRVRDAAAAYEQALRRGAWEVESQVRVMEVNIPGIAGAGETVTYFVDRFGHPSIYDIDFVTIPHEVPGAGASLSRIHSITYSVRDGRARDCADFCVSVLGLEEERDQAHFAHGAATTVVRTTDDAVRLVFSEPLAAGNPAGAGALFESAQHVTLESSDIGATVRALEARGIALESMPVREGRAMRYVTGPQAVASDARRRQRQAPRPADAVFFEIVDEPRG
jgi:4-hydroxyphenylpyruvate dioxygenase